MEPCLYGTSKMNVTARTGSLCARFILQGTGLVTASLDRTLKRRILAPIDITCLPTLEGHRCRHQDAMHDIQT